MLTLKAQNYQPPEESVWHNFNGLISKLKWINPRYFGTPFFIKVLIIWELSLLATLRKQLSQVTALDSDIRLSYLERFSLILQMFVGLLPICFDSEKREMKRFHMSDFCVTRFGAIHI